MKPLKTIIALLIVGSLSKGLAQENVFLNRDYWKANPSIEIIEADITAGNDITALNSAMFDAVCYALLEGTSNETIKHLLSKKGNEVNKLTHDGRTYLMWAGYAGNLDMVKYLVTKGANADVKGSHGYNAINFAARGGVTNTELYDFLLANGADIFDKTNNEANAILLIAAAANGYTEAKVGDKKTIIDYFVKKGLDIKATDTDGSGVFHYAAKGGNLKLLKNLVEMGAPYSTVNKKGRNAIFMASLGINNPKNGLANLKYLEGLGIAANTIDNQGQNPLHAIAGKCKDIEVFEYFIEKGATIDKQDSKGITPLMNAARNNSLEIMTYLTDKKATVDITDHDGRTALTFAVWNNNAEVVKLLLDKGAEINKKDAKGNSLGYYLVRSFNEKKPDIFDAKSKVLQQNGLKFNTLQNNGNTLLHLAAEDSNLPLLKRLIGLDIDINRKNDEGNTALHLAAMSSKSEAVLKYLVEKGADVSLKTDFEESAYDLVSENEKLKGELANLQFLK